ncbi:amino acid permease [Alkalicoccobacillus gibsonii]|uniref:amino acid permease n=1 Tax=Alkalicoccobacillus gibsonii TaxID=79881 RepID=UPI001931DB35|nr:amino acid permease [Alkalicoccobacillus gibsonii]MBM0065610.1 amino acid permease [Alkalicoccobacillus gibsonii]
MVKKHKKKKKQQGSKKGLAWWQLSLLGIGCTIGTGYFLGSSIGITMTGPSIVLAFFLAAIGTYIVFLALAKLTSDDPQEGSFCYYAEVAFGPKLGFGAGWNYWMSNILIIGSQLTALSILSQFWFEDTPLWLFAAGYSILSIGVVILGTKGFDSVENVLSVIKTAAIFLFIILGCLAVFHVIQGDSAGPSLNMSYQSLFPHGLKGFWGSLIYAFYAFGGIEVIGLMAMQLKSKEDAPKAGTVLLAVVAILYMVSLGLAVSMTALSDFTDKESPFVTALTSYNLPFFPHVFNAAIIVAGFSAMTASLFGVSTLLVSMAKKKHAPKLFEKKVKFHDLPIASLGLAVVGLILAVVAALVLPGKLFEYITTAAGILILFNWICILLSNMKIIKQHIGWKIVNVVGILLMLLAIAGILLEDTGRPGFYLSLFFVVAITIAAFIFERKKREELQAK